MGEPNSRSAVTSGEGVRESLAYDVDSGEALEIRPEDEKV
jgi:hypothetical protein